MALDIFRFFFDPDQGPERLDGWGRASLIFDGAPYWHGVGDTLIPSLHWTWVDLLEYLGQNWLALTLEQHYPFHWLTTEAEHPGQVWGICQRQWSLYEEEERLFAEEENVIAFLERHNLASAFHGMSLPELWWLRAGNNVLLVPADGKTVILDFETAVAELVSMGNRIADAVRGSANPRVALALSQWDARDNRGNISQRVMLATGWSPDDQKIIQGKHAANDFWFGMRETASNLREETAILAAARMLRHALSPQDASKLLGKIRALPICPSKALDTLTAQYSQYLVDNNPRYPWSQGYLAAQWLRGKLELAPEQPCDPERVLVELGVHIQRGDLLSDAIDALACWGSVGPAILMNDRPKAKTTTINRQRSTLAHELAHLLIDARGALPAAEVLGGAVNPFVEQRARAFAAELLLPREAARLAYASSADLPHTLRQLAGRYKVSQWLAACQLRNSACQLSPKDDHALEQYLAKRTSGTLPVVFLNPIE